MIGHIPDRKLVPDDPPEPYTECWYCNDDIFLDNENGYHVLGGYDWCGRDECAEAIGVEMGLKNEAVGNYSFAEFVQNQKSEYVQVPTSIEDYL